MNRSFLNILLVILILIPFSSLNGQVNKCALNLVKAKEQFNAGQIEEVPPLLLDCLDDGFTREDRIEAFKLLINAYIFDDYPELAEKYMLIFLSEYPGYEVKDDDPFEFVLLYEQFDNRPVYSFGGFLGMNLPHISVREPFGVYNLNEVSGNYTAIPGLRVGGSFSYYLKHNIELSMELMYSQLHFRYEADPYPFTRTEYNEMQNRLDIPLSMIYSFKISPVQPYLRAGINNSILISASGESSRKYLNTAGVDVDDITGSKIDISDERISYNPGIFLGGGGRLGLSKAFLFLDIRYNLSFTGEVVADSRRDTNNDNIWLFYNQQDDFSINNLSISIGYVKQIYNTERK
jgi:hypothetical protein